MRPILFILFGVPFPSWGVFMALGALSGFLWGYIEGKRVGLDGDKMMDIGLWFFICAIIGSRIVYVTVETDLWRTDPWEALRIWHGGMVLYGGIFGGVVASVVSIKVMRMPMGKTADVVVQGAELTLIFGRIGCILNGCCYGRPTDAPWAMTYSLGNSMAREFLGIPLHPAPFYELFTLIALFLFLVWLNRHKRFDGQVNWAFFVLYPVQRFIVEFFRGDPRGWIEEPVFSRIFAPFLHNQTFSDTMNHGFFHIPYLSASQFLSILTLTGGLGGYWYTARRARKRAGHQEG